jgi:ribosomal protein S10
VIKKNSLAITNLHEVNFKHFLKNTFVLFRKYKINLQYKKKLLKKRKITILRSPHINKTARDQMELFSIKNIFSFKENNLITFYLFIFSKVTRFEFSYLYKKKKLQKSTLRFFSL